MAADTLSLRERIIKKLGGYIERLGDAPRIADAILPVVEQEIQQECYAAREETAAAALAKLGEKDARLAIVHQALGLLTTLHGQMVIDVDDPMGMAQQIHAHVVEKDAQIALWEQRDEDAGRTIEDLRAQIAALRQQLQETQESFDAVVRAAGPFMPPIPEMAQTHCSQCGQPFTEPACGFAHAQIQGERLRETPAPPEPAQDPRYRHILSSDYYEPGKKAGG